MAIIPTGFTAALKQAEISITDANTIVAAIESAIRNLPILESDTHSIMDNSIAVTKNNIASINSDLWTYWGDTPVFAQTADIPTSSVTYETLEQIDKNIVGPLQTAALYSPALNTQLNAITTMGAEIRKYIYKKPYKKPATPGTTKTVVDDMSLSNLKIYASFLGIASRASSQRSATVNSDVTLLNALKDWLNQYVAERQREGI